MADESFLQNCLFFTANRLSRAITKIAEEEFAETGLTPMYGYLIRLAIGTPGISQKELAEKLSVTASTLTRFVDKLETRKLVERKVQGKSVLIYPTAKAREMEETLRRASRKLHDRYEAVLGEEASSTLTRIVLQASHQLERY